MRCALAALALAVVLPLPVFADITVKSGETLSEIAERHGVGLEPLMRVNGIQDPDLVRAGQRLVLPGGSRKGGAGGDGTSVIVQTGDTLSEIAERNGISLQKLMQLNGITDPSLVQAGRRLVIRSGGGSGRSTSPTSSGSGSYTVASGETLGEIAERLNTSVNRLMQLNGISDPTLLQAGSRLIVPGARSSSNSRAGSREHVVQEGETLSEIAAANNINVQKLAALNSISDPDLVRSGTRLRLSAPPVPRASRPAPRPAKATAQPKPKPTPKQTPKPAAVATQPTPANSAAPASPVKASNPATRSTTPGATVAAAAALSTTNNAAPAAPTTTAKPEADKPA
ncbi:MAG: LysM peptidoglycan-binding domain-containing protein, partial [Cyanobacteriota bacterium]|nr:LysM peptidoglycan-binding domain-containing protein [Cyanobacteriota bacterium]